MAGLVPRFEDGEEFFVAGLRGRYHADTAKEIPALWGRFGPWLRKIPSRVGRVTYGVCSNADESGHFDYLCGVPVSDPETVPEELKVVAIPAARYAVFRHHGKLGSLRLTFQGMFQWLRDSEFKRADGPTLERYSADFDVAEETGYVEICVPVVPR